KIMKKNNKGFSLVELIVVVLIMAIIATALTLAVTKYVAKSKRSSDANTAGELITAIQTAVTDYEMGTGTLTGQTVTVDTGAADTWTGTSTTTTAEDPVGEAIATSM
ncbi:MAG: type II secretion system GspH family protein, partial [Lachnospiraceae bacterium]|nr:type II secretion system GspH family protein [Lachnospiraceae bacterium]